MNIFDRDTQARSEAGMIGAWSQFRAAVRELIESYNRHPTGKTYPASIEESDTSISVTSSRGAHPEKRFFVLNLTIRAILNVGQLRVEGEIERWAVCNLPHVPPSRDSIKHLVFKWEMNERKFLLKDQELTSHEAAEKLLAVLIDAA
jgi:hypothetical protein